jgi:exodeoxyribonuclease-3
MREMGVHFRFLVSVGAFLVHSGSVLAADHRDGELRMVSYNVWYGFTEKPEPRHSEWLQWMKAQEADVVSLQELNGYTEEKLARDAAEWGHPHVALLKEDGFPIGFTSRTPFEEVKKIQEGMHHGLLRCKTRGIYFYAVHMHPSDCGARARESRILLADIASLPERDARVVLVGDFNGFSRADKPHYDADAMLEPFFARLDKDPKQHNLNADGNLDYEGLDLLIDGGYIDLVGLLRRPESPFIGSFPTEARRDEDHGTDRRLDYIFVSPNLAGGAKSAYIVRDPTTALLSDHYPVAAVLELSNPSPPNHDHSPQNPR